MYFRTAAAILAVFVGCAAQAATMTVNFSATNKSAQGEVDRLAGFVLPDFVTGSFVFDTTTPATFTSSTGNFTRSLYDYSSFTIQLGGGLYRDTTGDLSVVDSVAGSPTVDSFSVVSEADVAVSSGSVVDSVTLNLVTSNRELLSSADLPSFTQLQSMVGGDFPDRLTIVYKDPTGLSAGLDSVTYDITRLDTAPFPPPPFEPLPEPSPASVPLPASALMMLAAIAGLGAVRMRRGQRNLL